MRVPIASGELVANKKVACLTIGNAQQRFGQAHQRHALTARKRELFHERLNAERLRALASQRCDEPVGKGGDALRHFGVNTRFFDEGRNADGLRLAVRSHDSGSGRIYFRNRPFAKC